MGCLRGMLGEEREREVRKKLWFVENLLGTSNEDIRHTYLDFY